MMNVDGKAALEQIPRQRRVRRKVRAADVHTRHVYAAPTAVVARVARWSQKSGQIPLPVLGQQVTEERHVLLVLLFGNSFIQESLPAV